MLVPRDSEEESRDVYDQKGREGGAEEGYWKCWISPRAVDGERIRRIRVRFGQGYMPRCFGLPGVF